MSITELDKEISNEKELNKNYWELIKEKIELVKAKFPLIVHEDESEKIEKNIGRYQLFLDKGLNKKMKKGLMELSWNPEALFIQTLAKLSTIDKNIDYEFTNVHQRSPTNNLPYLITPEGHVIAGEELKDFLLSVFENSITLSLEDKSIIHLIRTTIGTAIDIYKFNDNEIFNTITFPYYSKELSFPINYIINYQKQYQMKFQLSQFSNYLTLDDVLIGFEKTLKLLNDQLIHINENSKNEDNLIYFSGSSLPSVLDALVFAYIYNIICTFSKTHDLRCRLKDFNLLLDHVNNMLKLFEIKI